MSKRGSYKKPKYFTPKIKFTPEDDAKLTAAVKELGTSDWRAVASRIEGRNPRQCRERWNNYVNPEVKKDPWTDDEDAQLLSKYEELGPRWHTIASFFANRSTNQIKNRFFSLQRRNARAETSSQQHTDESSSPSVSTSDAEVDSFEKEIESINYQVPAIIEKDPFSLLDTSLDTSKIAWVNDCSMSYDHFDIFNPYFLF